MHISTLSDINWESKVDHALKALDLHSLFEEKDYGHGLSSLVIVFNCRDPGLGHKQRVRLNNSTKTFYIDVMLDLDTFVRASQVERRQIIFDQTRIQLGEVFRRRRLKDVDTEKLLADLFAYMDEQLNGPTSTRFDKYCLEHAVGPIHG